MIVWLNGPHGAGKSSVARRLVRDNPGWRLFDPEMVGRRLQRRMGLERPDDFKDLPAWREATLVALRALTGVVVVPMTLTDPGHFDEIVGALRRKGRDVRLVTLMATPATLRGRISRRLDWPRSKRWALARVESGSAALADGRFGTIVWTDRHDVAAVAKLVLAAVNVPGVT